MRNIGLLGAALFALLVTGCGLRAQDEPAGDAADATTPGQVLEPPPSTIPDWDGEPIDIYAIQPGECFNEYSFVENNRPINLVTREGCEHAHQREVFLFTEHPAAHGVPYPGDQEMRSFATRVCYAAFEPFVGNLYELSELEIGVIVPNQTNFEHPQARYRGVHCYVERADGEELVGSAAGSGR